MDARMGGRVGSSPPLRRKNPQFFLYRGPSYSCGDLFANFGYLSPCAWVGFLGLPPLPTKIYAGAMQWCSGKFLLWNAIMALWSHILSL